MSRRHLRPQPPAVPAAYCIRVEGNLDPHWSDWFGGLIPAEERDSAGHTMTVLSGVVPDQAALRGILNKLWDLNLTLIAVERLALPVESE